jgi:hypothetical protein
MNSSASVWLVFFLLPERSEFLPICSVASLAHVQAAECRDGARRRRQTHRLSAGPFAPARCSEGAVSDGVWLRAAFVEHARQHDVATSQHNQFGTIFEIEGALPSPDGRNPKVRTVWMFDQGASAPRLITMVPLRRLRAKRSDP